MLEVCTVRSPWKASWQNCVEIPLTLRSDEAGNAALSQLAFFKEGGLQFLWEDVQLERSILQKYKNIQT